MQGTVKHEKNIQLLHPCFAGDMASSKGRIHLPVCPVCNIQCRFCSRKLGDDETQCPGRSACLLEPEEAVEAVERAVSLCPELTVVGIAGPGDTLASPHALETFRLIGNEFPNLIKCMSTNGLLLPETADQIAEVEIDTLTVTVNAVDPTIQAQICAGIVYHDQYFTGEEAALILIRNQLDGISQVTRQGITVKVNTVLIPGVNENHIATIAQTVAAAGASLYNIIPLIPQNEFSHITPPSCMQIDEARQKAKKYIQVFEHCQRCRADAVGKLGGENYAERVFVRRVQAESTFSHG